ncbi:MAG: cache domain-containing protein [Proteobacteria bacterium]|nr:cache domain-containing protein [Pseudomonadota bacterium]
MPALHAPYSRHIKRTIAGTYFRRFILISSLSLVLLGMSWLISSQWSYRTTASQNREKLLAEKYRTIESRAREAVAFINFTNDSISERIRSEIRDRVEQAHAMASVIYAQHRTPETAGEIKTALRNMRFDGGSGYFFAVGLNGVGQLVPDRPELEGTNMRGLKDADGTLFIQNALDIARSSGEGYFEYRFSKPGSIGQGHRKISYLKYFEPLDWYIGTGLYVDDVTRSVQDEVLQWLASRNYLDGGYIFAGTFEGIPVLGPFKGQKVLDVADVNGVVIVRELIKAARNKGGIVSYVLPTYDGTPAYPKISYSLGVEQWGWYVGSGIPTDDIEEELARLRDTHLTRQKRAGIGILAVLALCLAAQVVAMRVARRRIAEDFGSFRAFFNRTSVEAQPIERSGLHLEEFDRLAKAANEMIQERRTMEAALRESEDRYRGIFENIIDGYYQADLEGNLLLASPSAQAMTGWSSAEEIQGLNIARDFYRDPAEREAFQKLIMHEGRVDGFITKLRRRDGELIDIEVNSRLIYDERTGEPLAVEGIFRDITERKRTQELLVQTEKMMSVGGLAAGMAHEINNPLGGILQGVQNILRRISPDLPANAEVARKHGCDLGTLHDYLEDRRILRMLEGIRESGERAAYIVQGMLNFSRASSSRRAPCDLNALIDRAIELASSDYDLGRKYDFRNIELVRDYAPDIAPTPCTATEIEQVILNLLRNAAQAMTEGKTFNGPPSITIRTRNGNDHSIIGIEDNGPGMDEATRKRVFEPFFTTKAPGQGTGLGLSVSYFIITQNHGGEFSVESAPGQGSTFSIRLPLDT